MEKKDKQSVTPHIDEELRQLRYGIEKVRLKFISKNPSDKTMDEEYLEYLQKENELLGKKIVSEEVGVDLLEFGNNFKLAAKLFKERGTDEKTLRAARVLYGQNGRKRNTTED